MKKLLLATAAAIFCTGSAMAETKIGMITTLSGGGAGLGIDVRDGFMLAIAQSGRDDTEVVIEDDQRKPDIAVQLADRMIQSERVDIMTGIILVKPCDGGCAVRCEPRRVLSFAECWPISFGGPRLSRKLFQCGMAER